MGNGELCKRKFKWKLYIIADIFPILCLVKLFSDPQTIIYKSLIINFLLLIGFSYQAEFFERRKRPSFKSFFEFVIDFDE